MSDWFEGFDAQRFKLGDVEIFARTGGRADAPPLLLLHGFPQTGAIWQRVARLIEAEHRLVIPDLRGYGGSSMPPGAPDHSNYSKRASAGDLVALMSELGHDRFGVVGHDRGGRVAHRLALDHADRVTRLALLDIAPTLDMYAATDVRFASYYYHWFFLIQPVPLPERLIGGDPLCFLQRTLGGWGSAQTPFMEEQARAEYERAFCRPEAIHAACEDYRASATVDLDHDKASRAAGQKIVCDVLVLWGERGVVHRLFKPLALWQAQCSAKVSGEALPAGHYIPEELPIETAERLLRFFA